ncbi:alpha/beta hydrolase [Dyadobacter chenwenxiniae]|uniref:Alpha/beta hydrolase n=1 Tax=Dyadobacter chenwenxiniae TaxID=2906456 RepID=A0A9X1PMY3_9BACT|nr:alpha/beta hydrolase [Dyadobacter chenwenxiniae]MCF0063796.1 alpha/beta hydrolase [Dyadobacter chenwenxiniae]UON83472.1 alpha/beta hydrolase [Dyadobacter chenwenxiniae]
MDIVNHISNLKRRFFVSRQAILMLLLSACLVPAKGQSHESAGISNGQITRFEDPFQHIKQIRAGVLDVGYIEAGPANGQAVLLIHGWPYDVYSYEQVSKILAAKGYRILIPYLRGYGTTQFLSSMTPRNGQQSAFAVDMIAFLDALNIKNAIVGGFDWGARTANIMAALWPERVRGLVSVSGYLIGSQEGNMAPLKPKVEQSWWYQYYFATARGAAGYESNTYEFNKLIWETASPTWKFSKYPFDRSAASFKNPDHVKIVIDNYRWRLGLSKGEEKYDELETKLAKAPSITVPTVTLEGDANGAPHPDPSAYAARFKGQYAHHTITGIGHNLPQEAPEAFADAILEVAESINK